MYVKMKRFMDLALSLSCLILFAPLFLAIIVVIKIDSRAIFQAVERIRSISKSSSSGLWWMPPGFTDSLAGIPNGDYKGREFEKNFIGWLPQLFNILKGDMSIVGRAGPGINGVAGRDKTVRMMFCRV